MQIQESIHTDRHSRSGSPIQISVVMPCLNEAETLGHCITKAQHALEELEIPFEIVVADSGSVDGSAGIAEFLGAHVVRAAQKGYGAALIAGINAARGKYVVMADSDDSYDFAHIPRFIDALEQGHDLVMGNRFLGGIKPKAMPPLHRYLGNPVLSFIGRLLFKSPCHDFHCGMRGFTKEAYTRMDLRTLGMEFASEMVVKATLLGMRIAEVPTTLSPDGRSRPPHLRTWRDGWRHLRFLLLYSPRWLFLYPGILLMLLGFLGTIWLLPGARSVGMLKLDVHTMMYALVCMLLGYQAISFAVFAKVFAIGASLVPPDRRIEKLLSWVSFESGLSLGGVLVFFGVLLSALAVHRWSSVHFGELNPSLVLRLVAPAIVCVTLGCQTILSTLLLSVMGMARR